jgi:hypothetical protein
MKIIINRCYGGYGLSEKAVMMYAKLKGLTLYPDSDDCITHYYTIPVDQFRRMEKEVKRQDYMELNKYSFYPPGDISRSDPLLVQVVEELGREANDNFAELKIIDIPDDLEYEIDVYDGMETIRECHRSWS